MNRPTARLLMALGLTIWVSACELAPPYRAPTVPAAITYLESIEWTTARPADDTPRGPWWHMFSDPELDAIENDVSAANQDLKAAAARFDQARAVARIARADLFPTIDGSTKGASGELPHAVSNPLPNRRTNDVFTGLDASYEL